MEPEERVHVNLWQTVLELGSGRTGSVALCIEPSRPISPAGSHDQATKTRDHHHHHHHHQHHHGGSGGVFHAVKRVQRRCITSGGAAARVLRERDALQALKGVGFLLFAWGGRGWMLCAGSAGACARCAAWHVYSSTSIRRDRTRVTPHTELERLKDLPYKHLLPLCIWQWYAWYNAQEWPYLRCCTYIDTYLHASLHPLTSIRTRTTVCRAHVQNTIHRFVRVRVSATKARLKWVGLRNAVGFGYTQPPNP